MSFSVLGSNARGIKAKVDSLLNTLKAHNFPTCVLIQETLLRPSETFQIQGYQCFVKNRQTRGGGLLTAVRNELLPVVVSDVEGDVEILTIQVEVNDMKIRVINAYAPQEDEAKETFLDFWQKFESEIESARDEGCMIVIEMDANIKVGKEVIQNDPNEASSGSKIFVDILKRQNLHIVNAMDLCEGVITREQKTLRGLEQAVIDYVIVCDKMVEHLNNMKIDDSRNYVLTKYVTRKGVIDNMESDHNILFSSFNITVATPKPKTRETFFNFKCKVGQKAFLKETNRPGILSQCFNECDYLGGAQKFFMKLNTIFHQCFKKIRIRVRLNLSS